MYPITIGAFNEETIDKFVIVKLNEPDVTRLVYTYGVPTPV